MLSSPLSFISFLVALLANFLADLTFFSWECDNFLLCADFNPLTGVEIGMAELTLLRWCFYFSSSSLSSSLSSDFALLDEDLSEEDDFLLEDFRDDDLEEDLDLDFTDGGEDEEDSESGTTWKLAFL